MIEPQDPPPRPEVGRDLLDAEVSESTRLADIQPVTTLSDVLTRTRVALGLRPLGAPALLFVPLGAAIGPRGLDLITLEALGHLYPVLAVALAVLGLFIGLGLRINRTEDRRLFALATVESLITGAVVAGGCALLLGQWDFTLDGPVWMLAAVLGICASATASMGAGATDSPGYRAIIRIADLDDVMPIVAGGAVIALATSTSFASAATLFALTIGAPLAFAAAGWLLLERADDERERGVFLLGIIGLLGGGAVYLGGSPLLAGLIAGSVWVHTPGRADTILRSDLARLQHPLVITLLIAAGALAPLRDMGVLLAVLYVLTRLCGKLTGGWIIARALPDVSPADAGSHLLPPGVLGLAFALSFHLAVGTALSAAALSAVVIGTLASELLAAFALVGPRQG